ncbi:MAG: hypothetical protein JNL70_15075 [Saprospiraceae bacterium]|nr:hypothetical protein [Saprospiraceae bacterium]
MKNSQRFKVGLWVMFIIMFQKLVAQPQFIIQDKVVFVTEGIIQDTVVFKTQNNSSTPKSNLKTTTTTTQKNGIIQDQVVFKNQNPNARDTAKTQEVKTNGIIQDQVVFSNKPNQGQGGIIQDTVVFADSQNAKRTTPKVTKPVRLDSIHKHLVALKKNKTYDKANFFKWFNVHPTTSNNIEGYTIVIQSTLAPYKTFAEVRLARQKTNVWIDEKFKNASVSSDIKTITYSLLNRKADIETNGGYKLSLIIDAVTGKMTFVRPLPNTEVRIYKSAKLF